MKSFLRKAENKKLLFDKIISEIEDSDYSIGVIVKTDKSVSDALRCFDLFEYYWWLEASLGVDVPIIINTEYI